MSSFSRDDFNDAVRRALSARVGGLCSNPDCRALTSGPQRDPALAVNVGVAAHITAASQGGPRFDLTLAPDQRSGAENGIWLCQNCAKLVDNDVRAFTTTVLREWKAKAEDYASGLVGKTSTPLPPALFKRASVSFVEARLILPKSESEPVRINFGLINVGAIDAVFTIRDRTYFFTADPRQTVFAYLPLPPEEMLVPAIPNAILHGYMEFDFRLTDEMLHALNSGKARLFFYARGEYRDTAGQNFPLPFAGIYNAVLATKLARPAKAIIFE